MSSLRSRRSPFALLLLTWTLLALSDGSAATAAEPRAGGEAASPRLGATELPAHGRQSTVLSVPRFGRYSLAAKSEQGVALEVVDRMAGQLAYDGEAGARDGRVDLLLDRGEYRISTYAAEKGQGKARLSAEPYRDLSPTPAPRLVEGRLVTGELGDLEQRSYWLDLPEDQAVILEAAGRHLRDLRLWQDGTWVVDAGVETSQLEPAVGKPLTLCRLSAKLPAGLYLLTLYGGPELPWSVASTDKPFALRWGLPALPETVRRGGQLSVFGYDRFRVPASANYLRLELPVGQVGSLGRVDFDPDAPFTGPSSSREIAKEARVPVAELWQNAREEGEQVVTVTAAPGTAYTLQLFRSQRSYTLPGDTRYWIETLPGGSPLDTLDSTGVLLDGAGRPVGGQAIELGPGKGYRRKFNLLETAELDVRVRVAGLYQVLAKGAPARVRFEPFPPPTGSDYRAPDWKGPGEGWDLAAGSYRLTVEPDKPGIVELGIRARGSFVDRAGEWAGFGQEVAVPPLAPSLRLTEVALPSGESYTLWLNRRPGVATGLVLRELPLDLHQPLTVVLKAGEELEIPFESQQAGILQVLDARRTLSLASLDGAPEAILAAVGPGPHRVKVKNRGADPAFLLAQVLAPEQMPDSPLPAVPAERLAALPRFTTLSAREERAFDLGRGESRTFLVSADRPGLVRLESSGLLATEGNLRTRTQPSLTRQAANGVGRNFLIQSYLREGEYQLTVGAQERSAGHLKVALNATPIEDGGQLVAGVPARRWLSPGQAVAYSLEVPEADRFSLSTRGLGRNFTVRVEDADGWPVAVADDSGEVALPLPGRYRAIVLPEATEGRVLTLLERREDELHFEGHGPHELPLETSVSHLWREPAEGAERQSDRWRFTLPAPGTISISLSADMVGELSRLGSAAGGEKLAEVLAVRGWQGRLEAGSYELALHGLRVNDRLDYQVSVWPEALMAGVSRSLGLPVEVPLSIGHAGTFELSSFGGTDVTAALYDAQGALVAANDDRPEDWNFLLVRQLEPGDYHLRLWTATGDGAETRVRLAERAEKAGELWKLPGERTSKPGEAVEVIPLELPNFDGLAALSASSTEHLGAVLEVAGEGGWHAAAAAEGKRLELAVPVATGQKLRLRLWSLDGRSNPIRLVGAAAEAAWAGEAELASGLRLAPVPGIASLGWAAARLERTACLRLAGPEGLEASAAPGQGFWKAGAAAAAPGGVLYLLARDAAGESVRGERAVLGRGSAEPLKLTLPPAGAAACDLAASNGPVVVMAKSSRSRPFLSLGEALTGLHLDRAMAGFEHAALAIAPAGGGLVRVATDAADSQPVELSVRALSETPATALALAAPAVVRGEAAARAFTLPAGAKALRLLLGPGTAALLTQGGSPRATLWARHQALSEEMVTDADRLLLVPLEPGGGSARAELLPGGGWAPPNPGQPLELRFAAAGRLRLELPAANEAGRRLAVRGAKEVQLATADGHWLASSDLPWPAGGGTLLLSHGPGYLLVAAARAGAGEAYFGASGPEPPARAVEPPARLALSRVSERLSFRLGGPRLVVLASASPYAAEVAGGEGETRLLSRPEGGRFELYLPEGKGEVKLRGLLGQALSGEVEVVAETPLDTGEGLGPPTLIGAGESRAFRFQVKRPGPVGVGVRAGVDNVELRLLDAHGKLLGEGVAQMHELAAGEYLLSLSLPLDASPVEARPAVVGIEPPSSLPGPEVIRCYLRLATGKVAANTDCLALANTPEATADSSALRGIDDEGRCELNCPETYSDESSDEGESEEGEDEESTEDETSQEADHA